MAKINTHISEDLSFPHKIEGRYQKLFELWSDPVLLMEGDLIFDCNLAALNAFGLPRDAVVGKALFELLPADQEDLKAETIRRIHLALQGLPQVFEWQYCRCGGAPFNAEVSIRPIEQLGKSFLLATLPDVTKRKLTETKLKEINDYLENILENSPDAIGIVDRSGKFIKWNRAAVELFGYSFEDVRNRAAFDLYSDPTERDTLISDLRKQGFVRSRKVDMQRADGTPVSLELSIGLLKDSDGRNIGSVAIARDLSDIRKANEILRIEIAERLKVEEALRKSEDTYRTIVENTGAATIIIEEDTTIALANREFEKLSGYSREEVEGKKSWTEFVSEADLPSMKEYHRARRINPDSVARRYEFKFVNRQGATGTLLATVGMIPETRRSVASLVDVTDQKKLEEELFRADKLQSIGVLAGGIAHDFNNILTAIMGNISLARMYVQPEERVTTRLAEAEKATERARDLTLQLLTFSRGGTPIKKITSVQEVIRESANFALRGSNIRCVFHIEKEPWLAEVDVGQISQVINNMVINAKQAMPSGGVITISVVNRNVAHSCELPLKPGRYIQTSIQDQGTGIPEEHLGKVFDPYFTTKQSGSGLGLATSYSIISKHSGCIVVESEPGSGTTFHIYIPAVDKEPKTDQETPPQIHFGKGKVLLMDDEAPVGEVAGKMLELLGYRAMLAGEGSEAEQIYRRAKEAGEPFDAVVLDLTVPGGMGGVETVKRLRELDPMVKAIASSGYSNDPVLANFMEYGFRGAIAKPYRLEELSIALRKVMEGKVPAPGATPLRGRGH